MTSSVTKVRTVANTTTVTIASVVGDATKARTKLGWKPEVDFATLVERMVAHDLALEARKAGLKLG